MSNQRRFDSGVEPTADYWRVYRLYQQHSTLSTNFCCYRNNHWAITATHDAQQLYRCI